jgi:uncharacterized protein
MLAAFGLSVGAGVFGAMLGLGGGIIIVPTLALLLHVDIRYAIGASIVAVIATSSGAGATYVKERLTNIRVAMLLETVTTSGAIAGAFLSGVVPTRWLYLVFGAVLAYAAAKTWRPPRQRKTEIQNGGRLWRHLRLQGSYFDPARGAEIAYHASHAPSSLAASVFAGVLSGLLGVGGGVVQVPIMNLVMGLPLKVASATSNFMIGVTAAASAGVYFYRGDVNPFVAAPVALGVLVGALLGTHVLRRLATPVLRLIFAVVLVFIAVQMIWKGMR